MSSAPDTCTECQGKYGPGPLCATCESVVRLRLFVASGRCPGPIGLFIAGRVRECHRVILEEAERFWANQPVVPREPPALHTTGKAPPGTPPPLASGGGDLEERRSSPSRRPEGAAAPVREERKKERSPEVRETRHHRRSQSRDRRRRREGRSRSKGRPVAEVKKESSGSPRIKKSRPRSEAPVVEPPEEEESDEGSEEADPSPVERPNPGGEASGSRRSPGERRPRPPSHSPGPRKKWEGPIPAGRRRAAAPEQKKKKSKKNKGLKKKEHQQQWIREFGRYRGGDHGRYRR